MSQPRRGRSTSRSSFVWPGFGLVMGVGLGSVVGLLIAPDVFFVWGGIGAGLGLVVGAMVQGMQGRRSIE